MKKEYVEAVRKHYGDSLRLYVKAQLPYLQQLPYLMAYTSGFSGYGDNDFLCYVKGLRSFTSYSSPYIDCESGELLSLTSISSSEVRKYSLYSNHLVESLSTGHFNIQNWCEYLIEAKNEIDNLDNPKTSDGKDLRKLIEERISQYDLQPLVYRRKVPLVIE